MDKQLYPEELVNRRLFIKDSLFNTVQLNRILWEK